MAMNTKREFVIFDAESIRTGIEASTEGLIERPDNMGVQARFTRALNLEFQRAVNAEVNRDTNAKPLLDGVAIAMGSMVASAAATVSSPHRTQAAFDVACMLAIDHMISLMRRAAIHAAGHVNAADNTIDKANDGLSAGLIMNPTPGGNA